MHASELQRIALHIANQTFTRCWLHYNEPVEAPWLMAIAFSDNPKAKRIGEELEALGFKREQEAHEAIHGGLVYYTIERTAISVPDVKDRWESLDAFSCTAAAISAVCYDKPMWSIDDLNRFADCLARLGYKIKITNDGKGTPAFPEATPCKKRDGGYKL